MWVSVLLVEVEALRVFGFDVFVVIPDLGQVFLVIARGIEDSFDATIFFLVVDKAKYNGYVGALGDDIKAFFPVFHGLACAFRTDDEVCILVL